MSESCAAKILHVDRLELSVDSTPWRFADERRAEIDALFAQMRQEKPALFNGRVLLMHRYAIESGALRGSFLEADYASFVAWQRWGRPDVGIYDCFGAAAVQGADSAFLLGVMGGHTFNAGRIYFPCGTPDPSDVKDGINVDFEFSVRREMREETGLDADLFAAEPGWTVVIHGTQIAVIKVMRATLDAGPLRASILDHLASERQSELSDIRVVRSAADFDPMMFSFVKTFLAHRFGGA
jgi:8-oxo-dGTP pyrophosphatase MutT (NUDIX family)